MGSWNHLGPIRRSTHMKSQVAQSQAARKGQQPSQPRERNGKVWIIPSKAVKNGHITNENLTRGFRYDLPFYLGWYQVTFRLWAAHEIVKLGFFSWPRTRNVCSVLTAGIRWLTLSKSSMLKKRLSLRRWDGMECTCRLYLQTILQILQVKSRDFVTKRRHSWEELRFCQEALSTYHPRRTWRNLGLLSANFSLLLSSWSFPILSHQVYAEIRRSTPLHVLYIYVSHPAPLLGSVSSIVEI